MEAGTTKERGVHGGFADDGRVNLRLLLDQMKLLKDESQDPLR